MRDEEKLSFDFYLVAYFQLFALKLTVDLQFLKQKTFFYEFGEVENCDRFD
jgi:hypothetical protein